MNLMESDMLEMKLN